MTPIEGHDAPYDAPVVLPSRTVQSEWIDYNGHMNVAYYILAVDHALDQFLEGELGIGELHAARVRQGPYSLQSHVQYLGELFEGARFSVSVQLMDCDAKRMHLYNELRSDSNGLAATCEQILMNVNLETRRSTPYPDWAQARMKAMLAAHSKLVTPLRLGASIGLRRNG